MDDPKIQNKMLSGSNKTSKSQNWLMGEDRHTQLGGGGAKTKIFILDFFVFRKEVKLGLIAYYMLVSPKIFIFHRPNEKFVNYCLGKK